MICAEIADCSELSVSADSRVAPPAYGANPSLCPPSWRVFFGWIARIEKELMAFGRFYLEARTGERGKKGSENRKGFGRNYEAQARAIVLDPDLTEDATGRLHRIVKALSRYSAVTLGEREEFGLFPQNLCITLWKKYREILNHNRTAAVLLNRSHFGHYNFAQLFMDIRSIRDC